MMDKWEYCQQHPEECDEDGEYLYSDRPWEEYHGPVLAMVPLSDGFFHWWNKKYPDGPYMSMKKYNELAYKADKWLVAHKDDLKQYRDTLPKGTEEYERIDTAWCNACMWSRFD